MRKFETGRGDVENDGEIEHGVALKIAREINSKSKFVQPDMNEFFRYINLGKNISRTDKTAKMIIDPKAEREQLQARMAKAAELEEKWKQTTSPFEKEVKEISDAVEVAILEMIEQYSCLGDNVHGSKTSKYDDFCNNTDAYGEIYDESAEFSDEDEARWDPVVVGFGFDITTNKDKLHDKLDRNLGKIRNRQERAHLDNFISTKKEEAKEDQDEEETPVPVLTGFMEIVPIIIALESKHAKEFILFFSQLKEAFRKNSEANTTPELRHTKPQRSAELQAIKNKFKNHPIKRLMVNQIYMQINGYIHELDPDNEKDSAYLEKIDKLKDVVEKAFDDCRDVPDNSDWENDLMTKRIKEKMLKAN
ncbi:MAG: hypothetical protein NTW66_02270 [Candidatus Magasanikbacteria bacterium]|nr:hypothetical protein [Candidatus Magasanikbacteria bacterium]